MLHKCPGVTLIALRSFPRSLVEDQLSDVSKLDGWCVVLCGLSLKAEELPSRRSSLKGSSGKAGRRQSGESNWEVLWEDMRIQCGVGNTPCWDGYELRHVWWIMKVIHHTNQKHIWSWIPLKRLKMDLMTAEDQRFCERFFGSGDKFSSYHDISLQCRFVLYFFRWMMSRMMQSADVPLLNGVIPRAATGMTQSKRRDWVM